MSDLEGKVDDLEAKVDHMIDQIEELYALVKFASNPFAAFLMGPPKHRDKGQDDTKI